MAMSYPEELQEFMEMMGVLDKEIHDTVAGFKQMHKAAVADGELSFKMKELIALAIAISVRCDGCIATHVHTALRAGASRKEIAETVGVAVLMGGGPSAVYGTKVLKAVEQFEAEGK
jgi:AhpD family alkylhydroperoxidase